MGIRSDVYFLCQEPVYKDFKKEILDVWPGMSPDSIKWLKSTYPHLPDCYLITWEFVKWYADFVDIKAANDFIEKRAEGQDYHCVEIGKGFKFVIITEKEEYKVITAWAEGLPDSDFYPETKIHLPEGKWCLVKAKLNKDGTVLKGGRDTVIGGRNE